MGVRIDKPQGLSLLSRLAPVVLACVLLTGCDFIFSSGSNDNEDGAFKPAESSATAEAAASDPAPTLRTMTYNIKHGKGTDGVIDEERIGALIATQMPDLVSLQEVDNATLRSSGVDQAAAIAEAAGMPHYIFGRAIDFSGGEFGVAILSRFPIRFSGVELLPVTGGLEQRIALWVEVEVPGIGPVLFVNTHLEAYFVEQDRLDQIARLNELFADSPITPAGTAMPEIVLLAGDFNADTGSDAINLLATEFSDGFAGAPEFTFPAEIPTNAYDKVFRTTESALETLQSWVLDDAEASDHRPVIVDFEY
jgi:endonuclease/exonuclease/phosphatase family metal-dependent hydrolase